VTLTFDLETGAQCRACRGVPSCQFWLFDYSFPINGLLGVARVDRLSVRGARRHRYWSIGQLQTAAAYTVEIDK